MYKVKAVKRGCMLDKDGLPSTTAIPRYRVVDVPGMSEREAMKKAEVRLGAEWGVFEATEKKR